MINGVRPDVIVGYGSYLEALFRFIAAERVEIHHPYRVGYVADGMTAPGRRLIEEEFGIPVVSSYAAMESFKIGFTCEQGSGFHVHADLCHVRVIDETGIDAPPGEQGEIVITNLVNRGTVLLNYRLGDLGRLSPEPCPCGRTFPLLADLEGRREDLLYLEPGRVIHPRAVWDVFARLPSIVQYRLVQHAPRTFELEIVTRDPSDRQETMSAAAAGLRELLGDVAIVVKSSEGPLTGPGGKARPVVSLCAPPELRQRNDG
jgi:phenylacetate-CoA ligase